MHNIVLRNILKCICVYVCKSARYNTSPLSIFFPFRKRIMKTKEVIRPQVPLRPPCYDFSLVADPRFDSTN